MTATADVGSEMVTDLAEEVMFSDPFPRYAELRRVAPVSRVVSKQLVRSGGYMLTRYEDVLQLYSDSRFSSDLMGQGKPGVVRYLPRAVRMLLDSMVYKDDPDHARLRRLVNRAFTPRRVTEMSGDIQRIVDELLAALDPRDTVDLVTAVAVPLPLAVISSMLGVSDEDRARFHSLTSRFVSGVGSGSLYGFARVLPTAQRLLRLIERMAEDRRSSPDDGLITALVVAGEDGDALSPDEISAMIFLLMLAGHDTTANLIGSSILTLLDHPEQTERWRGDDTLTAPAVEELLRFTTPVPCGTTRLATEDVEIGGTTIAKGSNLLGMIISANRDETVFERPDQLDLGREPNRHITFAFGKHFCLGNQLARMEGQIAIRTLVERYPDMRLAVPADQLRYKPTQSLRGLRALPLHLQ